jgi:hypothetical protein
MSAFVSFLASDNVAELYLTNTQHPLGRNTDYPER